MKEFGGSAGYLVLLFEVVEAGGLFGRQSALLEHGARIRENAGSAFGVVQSRHTARELAFRKLIRAAARRWRRPQYDRLPAG